MSSSVALGRPNGSTAIYEKQSRCCEGNDGGRQGPGIDWSHLRTTNLPATWYLADTRVIGAGGEAKWSCPYEITVFPVRLKAYRDTCTLGKVMTLEILVAVQAVSSANVTK